MSSRWSFAAVVGLALSAACGSDSETYVGGGAGQSGSCGNQAGCGGGEAGSSGAVSAGGSGAVSAGGTGSGNAAGSEQAGDGGFSEPGGAAGMAGAGGSGSGGADGEEAALDVLVLFDTSGSTCADFAGEQVACDSTACGSMTVAETTAPSRLDLMREGLTAWLGQEASREIRAGLGYFGHQCIGQTSCEPADYATPAVPIGALPESTPAIVSSLASVMPTGETPTGPALRGACEHAGAWKVRNPTRKVVILLLSDGLPEADVSCGAGCCPTLEDAVAAAADCRSSEAAISTYVVAVGPGLESLGQIAVAGGTTAYFVGSESELLERLEQFRFDAIAALGP